MTNMLIQFLSAACVITLILTVEMSTSKYIKSEIIEFSEDIVGPALGFSKQEITPSLGFIQPEIKTAFQNPFKDIFRTAHRAVKKSFSTRYREQKNIRPDTKNESSIRVFMDESLTKGGGR